jgi:DNA-binding MarR family transcriptional regulator
MNDPIGELDFLTGSSSFRRIYEQLQAAGDKAYKELGLPFKSSWFPVYFVLSQSGHALTVMEIARNIAFSHITVKNIVRELEQKNLITVVANPADKRSKLISLTKKGRDLLNRLQPEWQIFSLAVKNLMTAGHPDLINILNRIDRELEKHPLHEWMRSPSEDELSILDYRPGLRKYFFNLIGPWLSGFLKSELEEEDKFTLKHPEKAYLKRGGFLFFASFRGEIVGCVALKRLDEDMFELDKLFIDPKYRKQGFGTKMVERCITRCLENDARELWLQITMSMPEARKLYYRMGFTDSEAPPQMDVMKKTEKIMFRRLK